MPAIKIIKSTVDALKPEPKRVTYTDTVLPGFAVRVEPSGIKSYTFRYRESGGGRAATGRLVVIGRHGAITPDQARQKAKELQAAVVLEGRSPAAEKAAKREEDGETLAILAPRWLKHMETVSSAKPLTIAAYERSIRLHAVPNLGSKPFRSLRRADVQKAHDAVAATSPIAANRMVAAIGALWSWAAARGHVDENIASPATGVQKARERKRDRALTAEEFARLGAALRLGEGDGFEPVKRTESKHFPAGQRFKLDPAAAGSIRLLALTGCRLREVLELEWSEVDLAAGIIRLSDERSKTGARVVPLGDAAVALLAMMAKDGRFVFGGGSARSDLKRPWAAVCGAAGLAGLTPHMLRHSFVTAASSAGVGYADVAGVVGHALPGVTARYWHASIEQRRKAATAIASWVDAAMRGEV